MSKHHSTATIGLPYTSRHPQLVALLLLIGFGQGLATPGLMHMVICRVPPDVSGMIARVASSTLQVCAALSVAVIGGVF